MAARSPAARGATGLTTSCHTLWIGPRLGPLERACIRSILRQGQALTLWSYGPVDGVPCGVDRREAAEILPADRIVRHHSGSVSLFSNWFRYALQRGGHGTWIDLDVYLLRPLELDAPYLLTEFEPGRINGGVLRMPADSPALAPLIALFEAPYVPPWLSPRARISAEWRRWRSGRVDLSLLPWGSCGPHALSAVLRRHGLAGLAKPPSLYSPAPWQQAEWIADPAVPIGRWISEDTIAIHLWNERIKHLKEVPAAKGSFLHRLQEEGA